MRGRGLPASPNISQGSLGETEETRSQPVTCGHLPGKKKKKKTSGSTHFHATPQLQSGCLPSPHNWVPVASHEPSAASGGSMGALWGTLLWKLSPFIQVMVAQTQGTHL